MSQAYIICQIISILYNYKKTIEEEIMDNKAPTPPLTKPQKNLLKNIILRMKIQRMIKIWRKMIKKSKHRINILKQWEVTEQSYIKDLKLIIQKIQKPMLQGQLITSQEDRIMFPNLDSMLKLSEELLVQIKKFLGTWNPHRTLIGNTLINFHKYFIIYREYCNNFYKSQKIIKTLKNNPAMSSILASLPMDIESYTIKPVQRPPKYQLLLREYKKSLTPAHKDYQPLTIAIQKYHDVNQENNQSMDLQIRNQKMIELDQKYGGIINLARVYLFEEYMRSIQINCRLKMYGFNDMIMIVKVYGEEKQKQREEAYKKIFLDGQSFVEAPMDGKYLINKLFICGNKDNLHCRFNSSATRDKVYQKLREIIHELYRKQTNRTKVKPKQKMVVMNIQQLPRKIRPKLRITVAGVQKRPNNHINLNISFQTYYILKITSPFPSPIFQYSYLKFEQLLDLEKQLKHKYKMFDIPTLSDKPEDMNIYDANKNKTKIIQYRQMYIERFVNFIFRCQELSQSSQYIAYNLGIHEELWQFVKNIEPCSCQICLQQKQTMSLMQFEFHKQQVKSVLGSFLPLKSTPSLNQQTSIAFSSRSSLASKCQESSICLYNSFTVPGKIINTPAQQLNTLYRRLTWLECRIGRIDYSLVPHNQVQGSIKLPINLLSLKNDENVNVRISRQMTVLQIIDQIAEMYKIETMRDFSLFIEYQGIQRMLDRDEKLWEVLDGISYQFQQNQKNQSNEGHSASNSIWKKLSDIKKWGQQLILGKKQKIFLRKYIFINQQLQIKACENNPERYSIIVQQIFYRFKNELLILNSTDMKKLCALYYIINFMDKLAYLNQANFQMEKFKNLLPETCWHVLLNNQQFQRDVYQNIKKYEELMENTPLPQARRSKASSNLFSTVEIAYQCVIKLVYKVIGYNTMFFQVVNYDPPTLPGSCQNLLLGINRKYLIIIRHKKLQPLIQIELQKLSYKVTVHSIFIQTEQKVLRFDGQIMYDIKKMIEIYKLMNEKFGDH